MCQSGSTCLPTDCCFCGIRIMCHSGSRCLRFHRNSSLRVDISIHSDTLSRFYRNSSLRVDISIRLLFQWNQDNVSEWIDMSTLRLLFLWNQDNVSVDRHVYPQTAVHHPSIVIVSAYDHDLSTSNLKTH
jgi:hypothetical protein